MSYSITDSTYIDYFATMQNTITGPVTTINTGTYTIRDNTNYNFSQPSIKVIGDAEFEGEIKMKGVNLTERLDKIEERLAILHPNNELEDKWEELKSLGEQYRKLEKEIIEKEKVWAILNK